MKDIYIVLSYTGTILSKIIKLYTKDKFAHVSIALDEELKEMYSFGRLNAYNPFWGGFVHEGINIGTFKRFKKTKCRIYELKATDEQYKKIKDIIDEFSYTKKKYRFNVIGLACVGIGKEVKIKDGFYCAEFIKYVLENAGFQFNLPKLIRPDHFDNLPNSKLKYEGLLKNYK